MICKRCKKPFDHMEGNKRKAYCKPCRDKWAAYNRDRKKRMVMCSACDFISSKFKRLVEGPDGMYFCNGDCFLNYLIRKAENRAKNWVPCQTCESMYDECVADGLLDPKISNKTLNMMNTERELLTLTFDPDEEFLEPLPQVM